MSSKKSLRVMTIFLIIFILLFGVAAYGLYNFKTQIDKNKETIAALETEIESNKQFVYVANADLTAGTVLEADKTVVIQQNVTALPHDLYFDETDMGKVLITDVKAYQPIMKNMVTDEVFQNDTRELEIGVATLMLDQQVNDYVDIRILFPDGSSYIVIPKLKIKTLSLENNLFYSSLSEDEIITLDSATIDAYTISGTKLYISRYVQANMQEEAIPNYPVRQETLKLMATDPNILTRAQETLNAQARAELEARLALLTQEQLIAIAEGHGLTDTAHANAYVNQTQTDVSAFSEENATEENTEAGDGN